MLQFGSEVRQLGHSGFVDLLLEKGHGVTIAAREPTADLQGQFSTGVRWVNLPKANPSVAYEQVAAALDRAQAERRTKAGLSTWAYGRKPSTNLRQRLRRATVNRVGAWLTNPAAYRVAEALESRITRSYGVRTYGTWLDDIGPDTIVVNSPRVNYQAHLLGAAADRKIARLLFYHTNKDVVASGRLDHGYTAVGVWNSWMKDRILQANPSHDPASIHITGCGHFDALAREGLSVSREALRGRLGLAPCERVVLYTAAGPGAVPEEDRHILKVLDALKHLGESDIRLVVRLNPMDVSGRVKSVLEAADPQVVVLQPDWYYSPHSNLCYQRRDDGAMLGGLLREAAVCVNVPSTVTVECALAGVPVVNLGYDLLGPAPLPGSIRAFWDADYYANVRQAKAALLAASPGDLLEFLRASLRNRDLLRSEQQRLVEVELGGVRPPDASRRYLAVVEESSTQ